MTNNFRFCNEEFLPYFCTTAYRFYNQFLVEEETRALLDSIGEHPECRIVFKYDPEKKVRAQKNGLAARRAFFVSENHRIVRWFKRGLPMNK